MRRVGIYHSKDLDGWMCGAIMKYRFGEDIEIYGMDYGEELPFKLEDAPDEVIIADLSLPMEKMIELGHYTKLVWVDHHESAMKDYWLLNDAAMQRFEKTKLEIGRAACELLWEYLFPNLRHPPKSVFFLGKYDTWRQEEESGVTWQEALEYQYGMQYLIDEPEQLVNIIKSEVFTGVSLGYSNIIKNGRVILEMDRKRKSSIVKSGMFVAEWKGETILCCNTGDNGSSVFDDVWDPLLYRAMCRFRYVGKHDRWNASVYTTHDTFNCGRMAKSLGGGGHAGAAGFAMTTDQVIHLIKKKNFNF